MVESNSSTEVVYRPVPEFPGYRVGNIGGGVQTCRKRKSLGYGRGTKWIFTEEWKTLSPRISKGRPRVTLHRDGKLYTRFIHTLVLTAFIGPRPEGMEACHDPDPDPFNCDLANLRWDTRQNNTNDKLRLQRQARGERINTNKLTAEDVRQIRSLRKTTTATAIAVKFGVKTSAVCKIFAGRTWAWLS